MTQLLLVYRYAFVLVDEAARMATARRLRAPDQPRPGLSVYTAMVGHLLVRAVDRAQRVHRAMIARGFDGEVLPTRALRWRAADTVFVVGWCAWFALVRGVDLPRQPRCVAGRDDRMSDCAILARALAYDYPDATPALRGVDWRVLHGESVAVVGANGAGKSTLLLHLNGLLLPRAGEVRIGGLPVTRANLAAIRRQVGFVFQDADDQLFMPTVRDDVAFGPSNLRLAPAEVDARVQAALEAVGAAHLAARAPYRLSGGEKRSVAIAGVLAMRPSILVLDEPSAGLDPAARRSLIGLLRAFGTPA